ncbi:alkylation response protein AidB-like acyl-CoA dehydrogenase [Crossiella cryophila]|uniref:Alkylation response protein AidB-like acyl-CoA dehydrogenase n=1 Tax=Crossiella cryophila TaxID=43355 RepID=A0A7W7CH14_9PSEU|nr:alkylation response protein AidB-like acyl-CoA dehydrogenase [Crossiella cryophila]
MNFELDETQVAVRELTRSLVRQGDWGEGEQVVPGVGLAAVGQGVEGARGVGLAARGWVAVGSELGRRERESVGSALAGAEQGSAGSALEGGERGLAGSALIGAEQGLAGSALAGVGQLDAGSASAGAEKSEAGSALAGVGQLTAAAAVAGAGQAGGGAGSAGVGGLGATATATATSAVERLGGAGVGGAGASWDGLWGRLGAADLLSLAVPERLGGSGLGVVEVAVLLTELGRGGVVSPGVAHLALGVLPVARLGTAAQQEMLLGGEGITGAVGRGEVVWGDEGLVGKKVGVLFGGWARWGLVGVGLGDGGRGVALVDLRGAGVEVVGTPTSAGGLECTLRFSGAVPVGLLGEDRSGRVLQEVRWFGVVGGCVFGEGLLGGALELTVGHVGSRRQFGRVLAEFQAVAMQVADVRVVARTVEVVNRAACWGVGAGVGDRGDVDVAGYWMGEKLLGALEVCHHLHGGLGLDVGYPLHRYSALGRDLTRFLGGLRAY